MTEQNPTPPRQNQEILWPEMNADDLRRESWHDVVLRTRRAELVAQRALTNATVAVNEQQANAAKAMSREEYQRRVEEWMNLRRQERMQNRIIIACGLVGALVVLIGGFLAVRSLDSQRDDDARRVEQLARTFVTSCQTRNAQLAQQEEVYQNFITIEQGDLVQQAALREQKIATYTAAIAALPQPVDCRAAQAAIQPHS